MVGKHTDSIVRLVWKVRCLNTKDKSLFDKYRVLDIDELPEDARIEVKKSLDERCYGAILKYRDYFREAELLAFEEEGAGYGFSIPDYFEDQHGNPLDEYETYRLLSGQEKPIIAGNLKSVIKLGYSGMRKQEEWEQRDSDNIAHFLQVSRQIVKSRWARSRNSISYSGKTLKTANRPDLESLVFVSIYFRQLISEGDKVFKLGCDTYCRFVDSLPKRTWIKEEHDHFKKLLNQPNVFGPILNIKPNARELIESFWYGALFFHGSEKISEEKKKKFRDLITQNPREAVAFNLNACFKLLLNHVNNVAGLIEYDFAYWLNEGYVPKPNIMWHWSIFGKETRENNKVK